MHSSPIDQQVLLICRLLLMQTSCHSLRQVLWTVRTSSKLFGRFCPQFTNLQVSRCSQRKMTARPRTFKAGRSIYMTWTVRDELGAVHVVTFAQSFWARPHQIRGQNKSDLIKPFHGTQAKGYCQRFAFQFQLITGIYFSGDETCLGSNAWQECRFFLEIFIPSWENYRTLSLQTLSAFQILQAFMKLYHMMISDIYPWIMCHIDIWSNFLPELISILRSIWPQSLTAAIKLKFIVFKYCRIQLFCYLTLYWFGLFLHCFSSAPSFDREDVVWEFAFQALLFWLDSQTGQIFCVYPGDIIFSCQCFGDWYSLVCVFGLSCAVWPPKHLGIFFFTLLDIYAMFQDAQITSMLIWLPFSLFWKFHGSLAFILSCCFSVYFPFLCHWEEGFGMRLYWQYKRIR